MTEHRASLFFDFTFLDPDAADHVARLRLAQAADPDWVHPGRIAADAARPIAEAALWDWTAWSLSPDFHPYVRETLDSSTAGMQADQPLCLRRSASAKALLDGGYRTAPGERGGPLGLVLALGAASRLRALPAAAPVLLDGGDAGIAVRVEIESITLHMFRTGVGLVVPRLRFVPRERGADIPPELLIEIVPRLGDERRRPSFGWHDGWDAPGAPRFALSTLMRRLVEPAGCRFTPRERVYSYVTVVADSPVDPAHARDVAFRLSRHYNATYRPEQTYPGTVFARPFQTVLHAASREGGCAFVSPGPVDGGVEFLETWLQQADAHVYLPMQVASVHEYVALLQMAQGAGAPIRPGTPDHDTIAALKALSHRFLLFRLRYRLLQISTITAHELAYASTLQALGIEALSVKISRDLVEVERRLVELASEHQAALDAASAARERKRERKTAWLTGLASGALAYITMASLGDHASEFMTHAEIGSKGARFLVEMSGQLMGVALGCWSFYYAVWWKAGDPHEKGHVLEHERTELKLARHHDVEEAPEHGHRVEDDTRPTANT